METPLFQLIIERIQREGALTFAEYMQMALYEPRFGYYMTEPAKIGWKGDYYTSSDISFLFAHCVGRQLQQMWEQLDQPAFFTVFEQGAGRGDLARELLSWAKQQSPSFHAALNYHTADIHDGQDHQNSNRLPSLSAGTIHCILCNELVDAFPVHIVEKRHNQLYEVFIDLQDGHLHEILSEPSSQDVAMYLDAYNIQWRSFADGWRAEINLNAPRWIAQSAQLLSLQGFILVIDYGDEAHKLYTQDRHQGTLASYYRHQFTTSPLARPGQQDLTTHVNFTALINEGQHHGLRLQKFTTQRQWLMDMQIYEELKQIRQRDFAVIDQARASDEGQAALLKWYDLRQRAMALTAPGGMGDFKVMILTTGANCRAWEKLVPKPLDKDQALG